MTKPVLYPFIGLLLCASVLSAQTAVTGLDPARHETSAAANANVEATFNTAMSTPSASAFRVRSNLRGWLNGSRNASGSTAAFNPASDLLPGEEIEATLTTGVTSAASSPLAAAQVWRFRAEAGTGPLVFNQAAISLGGGNAWDCKLGDLDGDGDLDAAVGNYVGQNYVFFNDGAGNFPTNATFGTGGSATYAIRLADVDNDGDLDIIEGNAAWNQSAANGQSMIHLNDGTGSFGTSYAFGAASRNVMDIDIGDIDGDGDVDIVEGTGYLSAEPTNVYRNDGAGNFTRQAVLLYPGYPMEISELTWAIRLADTDNDGDLELICGNFALGGSTQSWIYLNDGAGNYDAQRRVALGGQHSVLSLGVADWDNDGDADIAAGGNWGFATYLYWNNAGNFSNGLTLTTGTVPTWAIDGGDADGDGDLEVAIGVEQGQSWVLRNDGGGSFNGNYYASAGTSYALDFADMDGDGDLDLCAPTQLCLNGAHTPGISVTSNGNTITDGGSVSVAANTTLASLGFNIDISDADNHNVQVYTNISNQSSQGLNVNEWGHSNAAPPYSMQPASGTFNVPGITHTVVITALDFVDTRTFSFDVVVQGVAPEINVSEGSTPINAGASAAGGRDFGTQDVASGATTACTITISNTGNGALSISGITLTGANAGDFVLNLGSLPGSIAVAGSATFTVTFDPTSAGAKAASVEIAHNDTTVANPFTFGVQGVGTTPAPVPVVVVREGVAIIANGMGAGGGRNFGQHTQGSVSALVTITVENAGNGTLTLGNPQATLADFVIDLAGFSNSVAPGASTSFTIQFNAANVGLQGGTVNFTHNDTTTATPYTFGVIGETLAAGGGGNGGSSGGSSGGGGGCVAGNAGTLIGLLAAMGAIALWRRRRTA